MTSSTLGDRLKLGKVLSLDEASRRIANCPPQHDGSVCYIPRLFMPVGLGHRRTTATSRVIIAGARRVALSTPVGTLPFGRTARLALIALTSGLIRPDCSPAAGAVSASAFLKIYLGVSSTGGVQGSLTRVERQLEALKWLRVTSWRMTVAGEVMNSMEVLISGVEGYYLSGEFIASARESSIPLDGRAVRALTSTLALDLYAFMTYRLAGLRGKTLHLTWRQVAEQIASDADLSSDNARRAFVSDLKQHLERVKVVYPWARVSCTERGLLLMPSRGSVRSAERLAVEKLGATAPDLDLAGA